MEFIAQYWWIWFAGLAIVLIVVGVRSLLGLIGIVKDAAEIVSEVRRAAAVPSEERRQHVTKVGMEMTVDKIKKHVVKKIVTGVLIFFGCVFGLLLLLAIVQFVTSKPTSGATVHGATVTQPVE